MGLMSRRKGAAYECELAKRWKDSGLWPLAKRGIGQTRAGGEVPDVEGTPFWVEAKRRKRHNVLAAMKQAEEASDGRPGLVVARWDGQAADEALVVMRLPTFENLLWEAVDAVLAKLEIQEKAFDQGG